MLAASDSLRAEATSNTSMAWEIQFSLGYNYYADKTNTRYVRPARGGRING